MSESNGHIEVEVRAGKTRFRKCANRLEVSAIGSVLGELIQFRGAYEKLRTKYMEIVDDEKADPKARNEAFDGVADIERRFTERAIPLANRLLGYLIPRVESGVSPDEYDLPDTLQAATLYVTAQKLSEDQRKNSPGGSDSPSPAHPEP